MPGIYTRRVRAGRLQEKCPAERNRGSQPGGDSELRSADWPGKEVVEVTSEAPLVDTTSTQLGAVVNDRAVASLPLNARDTYQFLQLQPGVMSTVGSSNSLIYGSNNAGAFRSMAAADAPTTSA